MGNVIPLHRQIAPLDAALAAGNRNARNAGRKVWSDEDREAAARVFYTYTDRAAMHRGERIADRFDGPAVHESIPNPDDSRTYREVASVVAMLALLPWLALAVIWWLA